MNTTPVLFSLQELWVLHAAIRHEMSAQDTWKFPPASLALNDQLAEAILFCAEQDVDDAALQLSRGDCLVIDYTVQQTAKDSDGRLVGRSILLKTFRARALLEGAPSATAEEPERALGREAFMRQIMEDSDA